jgi:hypothetical protein
MWLPNRNSWVKACKDDPKPSAVVNFVKNPGTILKHNLNAAQFDANYQQSLRQLSIKLEDVILFYHEYIARPESYAKLQMVPTVFRNIDFVASTAILLAAILMPQGHSTRFDYGPTGHTCIPADVHMLSWLRFDQSHQEKISQACL